MVHSHGGSLVLLLARDLNDSLPGPLHKQAKYPHKVVAFPREIQEREQGTSWNVIDDLDSREVTLHYSATSYWLPRASLFSVWDDHTALWIPGRENCREPFWGLVTTWPYYPKRFNLICPSRTLGSVLGGFVYFFAFSFYYLVGFLTFYWNIHKSYTNHGCSAE